AARKPGFFQRLRIGWQLTKVSLGILRKEKGLILLPFFSLLITGAVWIAFFITIFFLTAPSDVFGFWLFYVGLAIVYFVTYFVSPVLIFEKIGPWAAVKRSGSLLRQTWGEAAGGYLSLGGIIVLLALPALLAPLLGFLLGGVIGLIVGLGIAVVYWLILGLVGSAAQSILVTALYRYATTGKLGFG